MAKGSLALGIQQKQGGLKMFLYDKKLQYPVKIDKPNPKLAAIIISQYGGPDGELGASLRYLSQRYAMPFDELKGLLTDIGTEGSKWNLHHLSLTKYILLIVLYCQPSVAFLINTYFSQLEYFVSYR